MIESNNTHNRILLRFTLTNKSMILFRFPVLKTMIMTLKSIESAYLWTLASSPILSNSNQPRNKKNTPL